MAEPFVGEIRMFGGNFAPAGWALCDGQLLAVSQNDALFSLLGTTFGGDGRTTFGLPDLRGRVPVHAGNGIQLGEKSGAENITLTTLQLPAHTHTVSAANTAGTATTTPAGNFWSSDPGGRVFSYRDTANVTMNPGTIQSVGGNQSHANLQPSLVVTFIISLFGVYPSRS